MPDLILEDLQTEHIGPVRLTIKSGDIVCISGESGAGKSVLLRSIADIIPHQGDARLNGSIASQIPAPQWRKQVGLLPAESQWWYDTVGEHFVVKDDELLHKLAFNTETWDWLIARCSTGEKQRLALLRLLCIKPDCLLLDEPTGSLDPQNTRRVESLIKDYAAEKQVPVLWVSHSEEQIARIARHHYVMKNGKLVAS